VDWLCEHCTLTLILKLNLTATVDAQFHLVPRLVPNPEKYTASELQVQRYRGGMI